MRADDIIDALRARSPAPWPIDRKTGLPYGWSLWLRSLRERLGVLSSKVPPQALVDELLKRTPPPPASRMSVLSGWQAFRSLFHQNWDPPPRDQRGLRWLAALCSLLVHLAYAVLLLWLAYVRLWPQLPQAEAGARVQVEFIGRGTPAQAGGGADKASAAQPQPGSNPVPASATAPAATAAHASSSRTSVAPSPAPRQQAPAETSMQPLQVSEASNAPSDFVLPPPTLHAPTIVAPDISRRELPMPVREAEVAMVEAPAIQAPRQPEMRVPNPVRELPQVRQREVTVPLETANLPQARPTAVRQPTLRPSETTVRQREIVVDVAEPGMASAHAPASSAHATTQAAALPAMAAASSAAAPASGTTAVSGAARTGTGTPGTAASGKSPATAATGGWAVTPQRGDDWGAAQRNRPGEAGGAPGTGLYDRDGRARLPGEAGTAPAQRGAPGGDADGWTRERLEQAGTWLKRPPYDYTPTSFDKYWVPNETLLQEWVRRGIKAMSIPIPGTNKRISCVVSLLQLGGGCGISDPNLNDQPAVARPPPDIPFKPELQEDNGSVKPGTNATGR